MTDEAVLSSSAPHKRATAVALVGFMGAGKSTVGQALAQRLDWQFFDLDQLIEARDRRTVEQIFRESGELAFRSLEQTLLRESLACWSAGGSVLALGGGAFVQPEIRQLLLDAKVPSVFLDATVEELFRRSDQPGVVRPLRCDSRQFRELYERRRLAYQQADLRVDTGNKDINAIVEEIVSTLVLDQSSGAHR